MVADSESASLALPAALAEATIETQATPPTVALRVPALIRRNTVLLAGAEAFIGTGQQMVPTLGGLMAVALTSSSALAGLATSTLGLTRTLISYPSGKLADRIGRKPVLIAGLLLSLVGALVLGFSMVARSLPLFLLGLLLFGFGNGASQQQRRLAAADFYPPQLRARGLGFVLSGAVIGAFGGPLLISAAGHWSGAWHVDEVALSWFLVPVILLPSLALLLLIHPEPRQIAQALEKYYPGYRPEAAEAAGVDTGAFEQIGLRDFLQNYPQLVAFACMFVLFGNMSMMMALAPMTMTADGMNLASVSLTVSIHVVGMFAFSFPMGMLADRWGRRRVLLAGVLISTGGTVLVALTASYLLVTFGLFLIGLGWCCGNIATAALVADTSPPAIRGRAMGANSSLSAAASVAAPLLGGAMLSVFGPGALVVMTVVFMAPCLALVTGLREPRPGQYAHRGLLETAAHRG